jgi:hypothetical protein
MNKQRDKKVFRAGLVAAGSAAVVALAVIGVLRYRPVPREEPPTPPVPDAEEGEISTVSYVPLPPEGAVTGAVAAAEALSRATLVVNSRPTEALVSVDGRQMAMSPCRITGLPSDRSVLVEVRKEGFVPYRQKIKLTAGRETGLGAGLTPVQTGLKIVTTPPGVDVQIDNRYRGISPLDLAIVEPGSHVVQVEKEGFEPQERWLDVKRGEVVIADFTLVAKTGAVALETLESGIDIVIDGLEAGKTVVREDGTTGAVVEMLEPGEHEIELKKEGFISRKYKVRVGAGGTLRLNAELDPEMVADYEVQTTDGTIYRGVLRKVMDNGTVRIEVGPGRYRNIPANVIVTQRPL